MVWMWASATLAPWTLTALHPYLPLSRPVAAGAAAWPLDGVVSAVKRAARTARPTRPVAPATRIAAAIAATSTVATTITATTTATAAAHAVYAGAHRVRLAASAACMCGIATLATVESMICSSEAVI